MVLYIVMIAFYHTPRGLKFNARVNNIKNGYILYNRFNFKW